MSTQTAPIYRNIIADAWKITKSHRALWLFGIFASFASTGGIAEILFRSLKGVSDASNLAFSLINGSFMGAESFGVYISGLKELPGDRASITVIALFFFLIIFSVFVILSQGTVLAGLREKKPPYLRFAMNKGSKFFLRILGVDLILKLSTAVLTLISTLPLLLLTGYYDWKNLLLYFAVFLLFFPAIIIINLLANLTIIDIVRSENDMHSAWHDSWSILKKHWVATVEFGLVVFFVSFAGLILLLLAWSALSFIISALASPLLLSIGFETAMALKAGGILIYLGGCALAMGIASVFQNACWLFFYERTAGWHKFPMLAKLHRMLE